MTMTLRAHLRQRLIVSRVPEGLHEGLIEYIVQRRPTGGFLAAVLTNDLQQAAVRADEVNARHLREIVLFLHNDAPAPCWGSPERVNAWLADPNPVLEVFE